MIHSLEKVKNVILVSSGKGGVGKSLVAANLSVALARNGHATGLLDADLYGPSIPLALGLDEQRPLGESNNGKEEILPIINYGVKIMSLGFLMDKNDAVAWRGPMASKALTQLLEETKWGELEYLVIDMPPGTGDICITLCQSLPQAKAIVVITPQQMAVADGRKAASMFTKKDIGIEILGVVENMSWFTPDKHPEEKYCLFGEGGGKLLADEIGVSLLAQVPLVSDVCSLSDEGRTVFASANPVILKTFEALAENIVASSPATVLL